MEKSKLISGSDIYVLPKGVQNVVKNKTNKQRYRYFNGGGISLNGKTILDLTYPIGSLYISKENVSPASLFGGTWEQLSADAYFKIVTSNGGNLGGTSSDHKIPIASMPQHSHTQRILNTYGSDLYGYAHNMTNKYNTNYTDSIDTEGTGGGQPYYPYYYGVYAWIRIS